jgi:hypothetical protein
MILELIINILGALIMVIPLIVELIKWIKTAIKEKNWAKLLELLTTLMKEAEVKFETGAERKEWVMMAIKASAETINYDIDEATISNLIDQLCAMSKVVNSRKEEN